MTHKFQRNESSGLLLIQVNIDTHLNLKMILDIGASHTTLDINLLYLLGYDLGKGTGKVFIETANGIIESEKFKLQNLEAIGLIKRNFEIQTYDFVAHGIISDYQGLLGLDFLKDNKFCIDLLKNEIEI